MNLLHQKFGIPLKDGMGHSEAERRGLLEKKPWVMVAPMMSGKNGFIQDMKSRYGAVTIGFSGWAKSARFSFGRRTDYSMPMSDHCDFGDLVGMVVRSGAEKVYTIHGFVDEFAEHLRGMGIDAKALKAGTLDDLTIALDGAGLVQTNIAFFQSVMASIVGAAVGYLFGSNARVQSSDG